ncbi:MAG TPA: tRNA epoxyqueuosine(34) reductase QueG [Phycisphaerales bacterium]|nr:tRNA epoxyqueuosine(34) reductase QueG [Phycisphaerales bacterium]
MQHEPENQPRELARRAVGLCLGEGFALAGVCDASPSGRRDELRAWLAAGMHGSMAWLAEHADLRTDPARLLDGARSIVMVADLYASRADTGREPAEPGRGRIARYARVDDYHKTMKKRLHRVCDALRAEHPSAGFRAFVDTAPVPERELAARAGLGWIGKHTLLIHPRLGSWLLLGGFLTTLELEPAAGAEPDHCGSCTRCIDACPTGAIAPYRVDARRCISYLTIERREPIDPAFHRAIGDRLFGCDICQEVCPHNSPRPGREHDPPVGGQYQTRSGSFDLLDVLGWDADARAAALRGTAMKRATLEMWKRNASIVLGNQTKRSTATDPEQNAS